MGKHWQLIFSFLLLGCSGQLSPVELANSIGQRSESAIEEYNRIYAIQKTVDTKGSSLVLFRNSQTRRLSAWEISETGIVSQGAITDSIMPWVDVIGTADFPGEGQAILFRDHVLNQISYIRLAANSYSVVSSGAIKALLPVNGVPRLTYRAELSALGDINGDGIPDLVIRDQTSGQLSGLLLGGLNAASEIGNGLIGSPVSLQWRIGGLADFDGDGKNDLVMTNEITGQVEIWYLNGLNVKSTQSLNASYDPNLYHLAGVYRASGGPMILFKNLSSGTYGSWIMNDRQVVSSVQLATGVPFFYLVESDGERNYKYTNTQAQRAELPVPNGYYYSDTVPATLDIDERVKLATFGLQSQLDPDKDYDLLWTANLFADQPEMIYEGSIDCRAKS